MKKELMQLVDISDKKLSYMGNPSYKVMLRKSNDEYLAGRTATNGSVGYWLCNYCLGKMVMVRYHFTKGGKCIIDTMEEIEQLKVVMWACGRHLIDTNNRKFR